MSYSYTRSVGDDSGGVVRFGVAAQHPRQKNKNQLTAESDAHSGQKLTSPVGRIATSISKVDAVRDKLFN